MDDNNFERRLEDNKAIVRRWSERFWGAEFDLAIVNELADPQILQRYTMHAPRRGHRDIKAFITSFREAFPDIRIESTAELVAEGDTVLSRWECSGTHTGPAYDDLVVGYLPAASGRKMRFIGMTVTKIKDGKIVEEFSLDDSLTALLQLGVLEEAQAARGQNWASAN